MNNILLLLPSSHIIRRREQLVTIHPFPSLIILYLSVIQPFTCIFSQLDLYSILSCSSGTAACTFVTPINLLWTLFQFYYILFRVGHHIKYSHNLSVDSSTMLFCFILCFIPLCSRFFFSTSAEALN